jgi:hypothetical protein
VQELIEGDSLATHIDSGRRLGEMELAQITLDILDYLSTSAGFVTDGANRRRGARR